MVGCAIVRESGGMLLLKKGARKFSDARKPSHCILAIMLAKFAATLIVSFVKLDDQNGGTSLDGCSCFSPLV